MSFLCKKVLLYCVKNTVLYDMSPFIIHLFVITDIPRWLALSPLYIWILIFFTRPHKVKCFVYMDFNFLYKTTQGKMFCILYMNFNFLYKPTQGKMFCIQTVYCFV